MSTREENVAVVRSFVDAINTEGFESARRYLSDDYLWLGFGHNQVQDRIPAIMEAFDKIVVGDRFKLTLGEFTVEGPRVAVEAESYARLKNDTVYNNHYHWLFIVDNGKITHVKEYNNSAHATEVLAPLMGAVLRGG